MDTAKPQGSEPYFLEVPFSKRWECHKDTIKRLFVDDGNTFEEIAKTMKDHYKFDANVRQYKYHLKQWNFTKSVPSSVKEKAIKAIGKRKRDGSAVAGVRYKGEEIDKKRLRRYISTQAKLDQDLQFNNNVFTYWNLPYGAFKASSINETDASSPFGVNGSTPSDISVFSPAYVAVGPSPRSAPSPMNAPTPTTIAIRDKTFNDRAKYLIQGMHDEFLKNMQSHEKRVATTWLYQFWLFSFKTTKYWGKGPLHWSPGMLGFTEFPDSNTTPNTPAAVVGTPTDHIMSDANVRTNVPENPNSEQDHNKPSSLCRWSIHCGDDAFAYEELPSPHTEPLENLDLNNPDSWPAWTENANHENLIHRLQEALKTNSFSNIEAKDLPLATT